MILLNKNIKYLHNPRKLKLIEPKYMVKLKSCQGNHDIIYDYISLYSEYICQKKTSCIEHIIIPDISTQINILKNIQNIQNLLEYKTYNLEGTFIKLMLNDDYDTLKSLIYKLELYNSIHSDIENIVRNVDNIKINENLIDI